MIRKGKEHEQEKRHVVPQYDLTYHTTVQQFRHFKGMHTETGTYYVNILHQHFMSAVSKCCQWYIQELEIVNLSYYVILAKG